MRKKAFIHILKKYNDGIATQAEKRFIEAYYQLLGNELPEGSMFDSKESAQIRQSILDSVWETAGRQQAVSGPSRSGRWITPYRIAATVLVLLTGGVLFYIMDAPRRHSTQARGDISAQAVQRMIVPGGNRAVLTLSNGQRIPLGSTNKGLVASQGNIKIIQLDSGQLVYDQKALNHGDPRIVYNTISTPRGGQYRVTLADGSRIWLNSASSIRFPTSFTGKLRELQMQGEAYFEVASDASQPFVVEVGAMKIKVLGTHFNVEDYPEEDSVRATLASGSVQVMQGDTRLILKPGQQASLDKQSGNMRMKHVNLDKMLAWKKGLFYFDKTNIADIMRQVSRWYNVDVVYATRQLGNKNFSGIMSRYSSVTELLTRMELTRTIHFKVEGRMITVMN